MCFISALLATAAATAWEREGRNVGVAESGLTPITSGLAGFGVHGPVNRPSGGAMFAISAAQEHQSRLGGDGVVVMTEGAANQGPHIR